MRARWRLLFWIVLGSLIGLSWVAQRMGAPMWGLVNVPFIGMVVAAVVAFFAMVTTAEDRWPAAVVLACWIPTALDLLRATIILPYFIREVGAPAALFLGGSVATFVQALYILFARPPEPPREDPIARAELR
jgi:hypothetical protein